MSDTMTAVKERPIIFSGAMVRAILDGKKTQTRRVIKPQPERGISGIWFYDNDVYVSDEEMQDHLFHNVYGEKGTPYGSFYSEGIADRLWVRETWRVNGNEHDYVLANQDRVYYRADEPWNTDAGWKPSIFMPRWASRITLQLTDVRVERVQDISYQDILSEGVGDPYKAPEQLYPAFAELWDSINAKRGYSWESNPWVWVIEFERVQTHD